MPPRFRRGRLRGDLVDAFAAKKSMFLHAFAAEEQGAHLSVFSLSKVGIPPCFHSGGMDTYPSFRSGRRRAGFLLEVVSMPTDER